MRILSEAGAAAAAAAPADHQDAPNTGDAALPAGHTLRSSADFICSVQLENGCIPWFRGAHADPWNHVEAAMGLSIGGARQEAERAYRWLAEMQLPNGAWWGNYRKGKATANNYLASHFGAYAATGVWHHYLVYGEWDFLRQLWPVVEQAVDFSLTLQTPHGDICWAADGHGNVYQDALRSGCSSIYKSLECALHMAAQLGHERPHWQRARQQLGHALRHRPGRFDRAGVNRRRYSMDWFYPILSGVLTRQGARRRLDAHWERFVIPGQGCRCVCEEPWVTVAESCELVLALLAAGRRERARELFRWLQQWRCADGAWWTGYQLEQHLHWPPEKPTWTAAATLLAAHALEQRDAAAALFTRSRPQSDVAPLIMIRGGAENPASQPFHTAQKGLPVAPGATLGAAPARLPQD